jgi:hypothetical protein
MFRAWFFHMCCRLLAYLSHIHLLTEVLSSDSSIMPPAAVAAAAAAPAAPPQVFTNTAAALPCELGPDGRTPLTPDTGATAPRAQGPDWVGPLSKFQQAWGQRVWAAKQQAQQ